MSKETIESAKSEIYALNQHIKILNKLVESHKHKKDKIIKKLNRFIKKREKQLNLTAHNIINQNNA